MSRPARLEHVVAPPERDVQAAVLELLERHPAVAFAWRSGVGAIRYHDDRYRERWVRYGFKGCPDIFAMLRGSGRLMGIETKSARGRLSKEQSAVLQAINGGGGLGIVAKSVDDVMQALQTKT